MTKMVIALAAALALSAAPAYAGAPLSWTAVTPISPSGSPYPPACAGSTTGTNYPGTEVEPWLAVNPKNDGNAIAVWQQDRFSNGGANALRAAYSSGGQWLNPGSQPGFSVCAGGTGDAGGFERASDPWVAFNSDGTIAYFMALAFNQSTDLTSAMTVSRSFDGGATWEHNPTILRRDASPNVLNDKNSLTADRTIPGNAYAIWDRLVFPNERAKGLSYENAAAYYGPTWFSRTTDGGNTWEPAHMIWDPGQERHNSGRNDQSIGNQIVQTGTGDLVDVFTWINNDNAGGASKGYKLGAIRSGDHGSTWSNAAVVARYSPGRVSDPTTGDRVRTGDIIPENAIDPRAGSQTVYVVWQGASAASPSSIYFAKSTDGGTTWSSPAIINKVTSTQAFTPSIRVDKNGAITVTYYDFRNDTASTPLTTDYWSIVSRDGGATWDESHVDGPFDHRGAAVARGFFLGDYAGLAAGESSDLFRAVFGKATGTTTAPASGIEESQAVEGP